MDDIARAEFEKASGSEVEFVSYTRFPPNKIEFVYKIPRVDSRFHAVRMREVPADLALQAKITGEQAQLVAFGKIGKALPILGKAS